MDIISIGWLEIWMTQRTFSWQVCNLKFKVSFIQILWEPKNRIMGIFSVTKLLWMLLCIVEARTTKKMGELVNEGKVGDRMIFDKIVACSSIEDYISLWKGRVFGTTFMVEISDKMNAKLTNWCNLGQRKFCFTRCTCMWSLCLFQWRSLHSQNGGRCGHLEINYCGMNDNYPSFKCTLKVEDGNLHLLDGMMLIKDASLFKECR